MAVPVRLYFQFWVFFCAAVERFAVLIGPEIVTPCPPCRRPGKASVLPCQCRMRFT